VSTLELNISGKVQKVGFRVCVKRIALSLSIVGTVRNLPDGRVHIIATGEPILLEKFISMLYGCPRAVIRDIRVTRIDTRNFPEFSIAKIERQESI
jgi:acylphosphatase